MDARNKAGIWAEVIAEAYLIENDYEVFISRHAASCDMLAMKDKQILRVEVKKASINKQSTFAWSVASVKPELFDLLLVVLPTREVIEIDIDKIKLTSKGSFVYHGFDV